jgi:2-aminomuconate deaminase
MTDGESIRTAGAPAPVGAYPHARRAGPLLFLSGIGPRSPDGPDILGVTLDADGKILAYDIEAQCHAVFRNVKAVLESAGAVWDDLVDVTVFLTDMKRDFAVFNRIYDEYFGDNGPCRTTVEVTCLPTPIAIELKCIARSRTP